jgi:sulfatase modifying factor 1
MTRPITLRVAVASASFACLALLRCSAFSEDGAGSSGAAPVDGAAEGQPVEASVSDAGPGDAHAADAAPRRACDAGCPGTAGPCEVRVGELCIDATEVTNADYAAFVAARGNTVIPAGAPCGDVLVKNVVARPDPRLPISAVTFCEARAYCIYAGKHLCGSLAGGPTNPTKAATLESAWLYACTAGTGATTIRSGHCQLDATAPAPSGTTCEGSPAGLFDMVGNVFEWIDSVDDAGTGANFVGGGYKQPSSSDCTYVSGGPIGLTALDVGFRCCSP